MSRKFTLLILLCFPIILFSQNLTGIWRGYFIQKDFDPKSGGNNYDTYKYEVQINQLADNSLDGVTYSYKKTEFYGKASLHGLNKGKGKNIIIKEIKLIEHHSLLAESATCLMTCYMDYVKRGNLELMTGTYTSINTNPDATGNCGEGTVYLEKVLESDFDKESFLTKKTKPAIKPLSKNNSIVNSNKKALNNNKIIDNQSIKLNDAIVKNTPHSTTPKTIVHNKQAITVIPKTINKKVVADTNALTFAKNKIKPGAEMFVVKNPVDNQIDTFYKYKIDTTVYVYDSPTNKRYRKNTTDSITVNKIDNTTDSKKLPTQDSLLKPLTERKNLLVNTIEVDEKDVKVDYYDNGEIDNDTISVFDNTKKVVTAGRLSYTPITLNLSFNKDVPVHEIVTVADNLGDIPPNTALMVITFGKKRYEINITSDEKTNAKVILEYNGKLKLK